MNCLNFVILFDVIFLTHMVRVLDVVVWCFFLFNIGCVICGFGFSK